MTKGCCLLSCNHIWTPPRKTVSQMNQMTKTNNVWAISFYLPCVFTYLVVDLSRAGDKTRDTQWQLIVLSFWYVCWHQVELSGWSTFRKLHCWTNLSWFTRLLNLRDWVHVWCLLPGVYRISESNGASCFICMAIWPEGFFICLNHQRQPWSICTITFLQNKWW